MEKSRARAENGKTQFPGARGPKIERKVTTLSGMVVRNFFTFCVFADWIPRGGTSQKNGFLGPRAALGTSEKFRAGNRKMQFPGARGTFEEKIRPPQKFLPVIAQLFYILGEKSKNTGFLGPFGLGQPLGTKRNSGPKTEKRDFPELGALSGEKFVRPKISPQNCATFLHFVFWPSGPPRTGNREILVF